MSQRILLITNGLPPRKGGSETLGYELVRRLPETGEGSAVVYTSAGSGGHESDEAQPLLVVRDSARTLLPTRRVARRAADLVQEYGCDRVVLGTAVPLGLLARGLRTAGAKEIIALTHGSEVGWSRIPGVRPILRRIGEDVDALTYPGEFVRGGVQRAVGSTASHRLVRLRPGVDTDLFHPEADGSWVRERFRLDDGPVILCVCRLVPHKGVDALIRAMSWVRARYPRTRLLVVGDGPDERRLRALAAWAGVDAGVVFAGGQPHERMPAFYAAADLFALPSRPRRTGPQTEGLGLVYLEAAACGLPVLAGDSGVAPETVRHGETGYVVDGRDPRGVAERANRLLWSPGHARTMGRRGREWMLDEWTWEQAVRCLEMLHS
ncbi:glycosyltransferase family 4 protein [Allosalinactinospora lopnorensis]|uniref:glycosyltransferase family 4 protein n=1 Tax=Allosalinactinospora lopnorensis TaxID=1352348 RepID=UPI000623BBF8|nr:glycosyltransferase family 4 protein [Allosalinactinospora lopnorensis]